uniref:Uncharacterized protein n=1 Tax=Arundo donax TaxID=35708 RepID=A0A0A8Y819_ARUDO
MRAATRARKQRCGDGGTRAAARWRVRE